MTAELIARALGGRRCGSGWIARCPAHNDNNPSLHIRMGESGEVLVHCFAGCEQSSVIHALRARDLWRRRKPLVFKSYGAEAASPNRSAIGRADAERSKYALQLWRASLPATHTLVETYLRSRSLCLPESGVLRFVDDLKHPTGGTWPAMVALVARGEGDVPQAIHRTFLARDGSGKAPVDPQKMMLGPCRGGAVHLAKPNDLLMVGEGIETCLAAMQQTGNPAWAALSASGLRALDLPETVREVIVLADGDDAGEAAACDCGRRWEREGRRVRIARPPRGMDFNDMLIGHGRDRK